MDDLEALRVECARLIPLAAKYEWLKRFDHFALVDAMLDTTEYNTLDAAVEAAMASEARGA